MNAGAAEGKENQLKTVMHCKFCKYVVYYLHVRIEKALERFWFIISIGSVSWFSQAWVNVTIVPFTPQVNNNNTSGLCDPRCMHSYAYTIGFYVNLLQTQIYCFSVDHTTEITLLRYLISCIALILR